VSYSSRRAGCSAAAAERKANTIVNAGRVIALFTYHFVIAMWRAKEAESGMDEPF